MSAPIPAIEALVGKPRKTPPQASVPPAKAGLGKKGGKGRQFIVTMSVRTERRPEGASPQDAAQVPVFGRDAGNRLVTGNLARLSLEAVQVSKRTFLRPWCDFLASSFRVPMVAREKL